MSDLHRYMAVGTVIISYNFSYYSNLAFPFMAILIDPHICFFLFRKALTVLRGPLAYPNGLLDLHIETFW
jgi:hypothetical protein